LEETARTLLRHPLGAALLVTALLAAPAAACPDWRLPSQTAALDAGGPGGPQRFTLQAGGPHDLRAGGLPGSGRAAAAPNLELGLRNAAPGASLSLTVEAPCDTVLLVNDAGGQWHSNDDTNGLNPALTLTGAASGTCDVWAGPMARMPARPC
jgi:hypothetical protein